MVNDLGLDIAFFTEKEWVEMHHQIQESPSAIPYDICMGLVPRFLLFKKSPPPHSLLICIGNLLAPSKQMYGHTKCSLLSLAISFCRYNIVGSVDQATFYSLFLGCGTSKSKVELMLLTNLPMRWK